MSIRLWVLDLQSDDSNVQEAARHGVTQREIRQVLDNDPTYFRNKKKHKAPYGMIGMTDGGRLLTIPLARTVERETWRPATAFDANADDWAHYRAERATQQK